MAQNDALLRCPNCGAAVAPGDGHCAFCRAALATQICPQCTGTCFRGFDHCPSCGAALVTAAAAPTAFACPGCKSPLSQLRLGDVVANQCGACFGLWLSNTDFQHICEVREEHAAVLGAPALAPEAQDRRSQPAVRYVPCPSCQKLMNRLNFAHCSGVIVDVCKSHGVWFDRDELHDIVVFIEKGGMERSRDREMQALEDERRKLQDDRDNPAGGTLAGMGPSLSMPISLGTPTGSGGQVLGQALGSLVNLAFNFFG